MKGHTKMTPYSMALRVSYGDSMYDGVTKGIAFWS